MGSFRLKPYLKQRIRRRIGRARLNYFRNALFVWLGWAIAAYLLTIIVAEEGVILAVLLLGAIVLLSLAYVAKWLQMSLRRERHWEAQLHEENVWKLNALVKPRRPWPLWQGYMADTALLECIWHLIIEKRPNRLVELGSGFSSLVIGYALEAAGHGTLFSLEDNMGYAARSRRMLEEHGLSARANVIDSPLVKYTLDGVVHYWYALNDLSTDLPIDYLFVDGPAGYLHPRVRQPALPLLYDRLASDAVIVVDDTGRPGESAMIQQWLDSYTDLQVDDSLSSTHFTVLNVCRQGADARTSESLSDAQSQATFGARIASKRLW